MDSQQNIKANILIQIQNVVMHRLVSKQKSLFTSGTLKIAKIQNPTQNTVYFINMNSFYYTLNRSVIFAKIQYDDTVSYIFTHFDNGLSAITLLKKPETIHNFEQIISNASTLIKYQEVISNPDFKAKIDQHCPGIQKQPIQGADKIKATIRQTGKIIGFGFKALGTFLANGVHTVGQYIGNKLQQPTQKTTVAPQTKQKWQTLKKGTSNAFSISKDLFNKYITPVVAVGVGYGKQVVQKIQSSDNSAVKYARELASTGGQAASTAFQGLSQGATQVSTHIGQQSRKIVNKKYGEDYVHTFLPDQEKKQKQQKIEEKQEDKLAQETAHLTLNETTDDTKPLYPHLQHKQEKKDETKKQ